MSLKAIRKKLEDSEIIENDGPKIVYQRGDKYYSDIQGVIEIPIEQIEEHQPTVLRFTKQ